MRHVIAASLAGVALAAMGGGGGGARAAEVDCDQRAWHRSAAGSWVRRAVEVAGYPVTGCTGVAWLASTPVSTFLVWTAEPWRPPAGLRPASEPYLRGAYTDGARVVWQAQGLAVWVAPAAAGAPLPGPTAFGWLQAATHGLPRRLSRLAFMPTPAAALRACRSDPRLAPACPTRIPRVDLRDGTAGWRTYPAPPRPVDGVFGLQLGGEIPGRPELMRPPGNLHVEAEVARERLFGVRPAWPTGKVTRPGDGLVREERSQPVLLGRVTWNGKRGSVALIPGYPAGGSQGNHVAFRWRAHGLTYIVGMHAWEPFTEAFATLRRIVAALPG